MIRKETSRDVLQVLVIGCLTRFSTVRLSWCTSQLCRSFLKPGPMRKAFRYLHPYPWPPESSTTMKGPIVTCRFRSRWGAGFRALSFQASLPALLLRLPWKSFLNPDRFCFLSQSSWCPVLLCHLSDKRGRSSDLILTSGSGAYHWESAWPEGRRCRFRTSHWAPHLVPQWGILQ